MLNIARFLHQSGTGRHHETDEVPGIPGGCSHPCDTPDTLCGVLLSAEGIAAAELWGLIGPEDTDLTRW